MTDYDYDVVRSAISDSEPQSVIVTDYVVVASTIEEDGSRSVRMISDCDQGFKVLGLLHHALLMTRASKYGPGEDD